MEGKIVDRRIIIGLMSGSVDFVKEGGIRTPYDSARLC